MELLRKHGLDIEPIPLRPGKDDRIEHTLRHFLSAQETWAKRPPYAAKDPAEALAELRRRGWDPTGVSVVDRHDRRHVPDKRWWEPDRLAAVSEVHDRGYYPRYAMLVEHAGPPQVGGGWVLSNDDRWRAEVGGYIVIAALQPGRLQVISAYRNVVLNETRPPVLSASLGELLQARLRALGPNCQVAPQGASPAASGAAVVRGERES